MSDVFNTPVEINGSTDDVHLRVKSSLTQAVRPESDAAQVMDEKDE
jgi:hypothetical protein